MYYGQADHAVIWFCRLGYELPHGINAADFILDLASSDIANDERCASLSRHRHEEHQEQDLKLHPRRIAS